MEPERKRRLGDLLRERGLITEADLDRALAEGRSRGLRLGEALIELGLLTEDEILWVLSEQLRLSLVQVTPEQLDPAVVGLLPEELERRHLILPLLRVGGELSVVVSDPLQDELFKDVARLTGCELKLGLARSGAIRAGLDQVYGRREAAAEGGREFESAYYSQADLTALAADKTAGTLLKRLVADALGSGVNTIHLELRRGQARVRFRKDGALEPVLAMDPGWGQALMTRLRLLAGPESANEWRVEIGGDEVTAALEVHRLTVRGGEAMTLRVLGKRARKMPLAKLGLSAAQKARVEAMLASPGLIVVTGPADSGRATTVLSLLDRFDPERRRVVTVEDWVRTETPEYLQVPARAFEGGPERLASLARLDPDVIYLESLRYPDEYGEALTLGMAGTFIFTLMGFPRAPAALGSLAGSGVPADDLAQGLSGIIAQRLVRRLCERCRKEVKLKKAQLEGFGPEFREKLAGTLFEAKGCPACGGTGFAGREAVFEVLAVESGLRSALSAGTAIGGAAALIPAGQELPDQIAARAAAGRCAWTELLHFR